MSVLSVPELEAKPWPTLGALVCQFIEQNLVFGPGDLRGQPATLDDEKRGLIYRMYEVYPKGTRAPAAGGSSGRDLAAEGQREDGTGGVDRDLRAASGRPGAVRRLRSKGQPDRARRHRPVHPDGGLHRGAGRGARVRGAARHPRGVDVLRSDFDIGLDRVIRKGGDGKCEPLASSPNSSDGARTTFQVFDETHRMARPRLKAAHRTMLANIPKRKLADAWSLETTTAPAPGEGSIAEDTMRFAQQIADGKISEPKLFFSTARRAMGTT
jgi:hypothetical protein